MLMTTGVRHGNASNRHTVCLQMMRDLGGGAYEMETVSHSKDAAETGLCAACGAPGAKSKCAGCFVMRYCGRACQRSHWKAGHKGECATVKAQADTARREAKAGAAAAK